MSHIQYKTIRPGILHKHKEKQGSTANAANGGDEDSYIALTASSVTDQKDE